MKPMVAGQENDRINQYQKPRLLVQGGWDAPAELGLDRSNFGRLPRVYFFGDTSWVFDELEFCQCRISRGGASEKRLCQI